jgi:hypothetical protein
MHWAPCEPIPPSLAPYFQCGDRAILLLSILQQDHQLSFPMRSVRKLG